MDAVTVDARARITARTVRTGFRACRCDLARGDNPSTRLECAAPVIGRDCLLDDRDTYDLADGEPGRWRWVTFDYDGRPRTPPDPDLRVERALTYQEFRGTFRTDLEAEWLYESDLDRWRTAFGDDVSPINLPLELWTHAPGTVSTSFFPTDCTSLLTPCRNLTSHYWSGRLAARIPTPPPAPPERLCFDGRFPLIPPTPCLACDSSFPEPWVGFRGAFLGPLCVPSLSFDDLVLELQTVVLHADRALTSAAIEEVVRVSDPWVVAAEPTPWIADAPVRLVAVRPDGTEISSVLIQTEAGLALQQPPQPCDNPPNCPPLAASVDADTPAPRTDHLVVLSALRHTLWMGGGVGSDGRLMADLWMFDLTTRRWTEIVLPPGSIRPGRVLAATYSPARDVLFVLDEATDDRGRTTARLLRLDVLGTDARVLATWPRRSRNTRFAMVTDTADAVLIAASPDRGSHLVLRLLVEDDLVTPDGLAEGRGALASGLAVGGDIGMTILVHEPGEGVVPIGHAIQDLGTIHGEEFRRCF